MGNAWVFPSISHSITVSTASDNFVPNFEKRGGSEKNEYLRGLAKDIWVWGRGLSMFLIRKDYLK